MKAMVLCAGFGTRLGTLTQTTPKCLIDIGGITILEHVIEQLRVSGVSSIMINLHYLGDQIRDFVYRKNSFGLDIHFSQEDQILGTGGGLKKVRKFFENENAFLMHNSDIYSEIDLSKLIEAHQSKSAAATLAVMDRPSSRNLLFDENQQLVGWENTDKNTSKVVREVLTPIKKSFSGIQALSPSVFEHMPSDQAEFDIIGVYLRASAQGQLVQAWNCDGVYWMDMGTPERLKKLKERRRTQHGSSTI